MRLVKIRSTCCLASLVFFLEIKFPGEHENSPPQFPVWRMAVLRLVSYPLSVLIWGWQYFVAIGRGALKLAISGTAAPHGAGYRIEVVEYGLYLRDTYDFYDDPSDWFSQFLGNRGVGRAGYLTVVSIRCPAQCSV